MTIQTSRTEKDIRKAWLNLPEDVLEFPDIKPKLGQPYVEKGVVKAWDDIEDETAVTLRTVPGFRPSPNPLLLAFRENVRDPDPDDFAPGGGDFWDVVELWEFYMANGDQEVSWVPEHIEHFNHVLAKLRGVFHP